MIPRSTPPKVRDEVRLLTVDPESQRVAFQGIRDLPSLLHAGELVVVNDAATLPASLRASVDGASVELRLLSFAQANRWWVVAYLVGSWRDDTEQRELATLRPGTTLSFGGRESALLTGQHPDLPGVYELDFGPSGTRALYRYGKPIQYSHLSNEIDLWDVQTVYAARPWAIEMPSAGRPLSWHILGELRRRGVEIARLTHAAGVSSTGVSALDARLPLPERYEIPRSTARAVERARAGGRRILAVGTSVVRALEDSAQKHGDVQAGASVATLTLGPESKTHVVDALLSGIHAPNETHYNVASSVGGAWAARVIANRAGEAGYHTHEFGDLSLVAPGVLAIRSPTPKRARGELHGGAAAG